MLELTGASFAALDTAIRAVGDYSYVGIENAIRKHFQIEEGDTDAFDEIHDSISELKAHYISLGLTQPGV